MKSLIRSQGSEATRQYREVPICGATISAQRAEGDDRAEMAVGLAGWTGLGKVERTMRNRISKSKVLG